MRAARGSTLSAAQLADRSAAAHADEQPRSRGRRAARGPGGLRRHRQGSAQLGVLRRHRRIAHEAARRPVAAGPVRQAGRRVRDPSRRAAGADRQLEPGAALGQLGALQRARPQGPDDVRPDDRGLVDLHRQPGHRAGHLRDLRRGRAPALRRRLGGQVDTHRRAGRHGRCAAARGDHGRRVDDRGRVRPDAHRHAAQDRLPRQESRLDRRSDEDPGRSRRPGFDRPARQRRRADAGVRQARAHERLAAVAGHRPDLGPRPGQRLPARALVARALEGPAAQGPRGSRDLGARGDCQPRARDPRLQGDGDSLRRLRQQHPPGSEERGRKGRLRLSRLRAGLRATAVLPRQGAVPLGRALGRPRGHLPDRRQVARAVPGQRGIAALARHGAKTDQVPGPAGAHLLAGAGRARTWPGSPSTRW